MATLKEEASQWSRQEILDLAGQVADHYQIPRDMFQATMGHESGDFNPLATGTSGEFGVAQFMPDTARKYGLNVTGDDDDERWHIPKSLDAAARHLKDNYESTQSWEKSLRIYNTGRPYDSRKAREYIGNVVGYWTKHGLGAAQESTGEAQAAGQERTPPVSEQGQGAAQGGLQGQVGERVQTYGLPMAKPPVQTAEISPEMVAQGAPEAMAPQFELPSLKRISDALGVMTAGSPQEAEQLMAQVREQAAREQQAPEINIPADGRGTEQNVMLQAAADVERLQGRGPIKIASAGMTDVAGRVVPGGPPQREEPLRATETGFLPSRKDIKAPIDYGKLGLAQTMARMPEDVKKAAGIFMAGVRNVLLPESAAKVAAALAYMQHATLTPQSEFNAQTWQSAENFGREFMNGLLSSASMDLLGPGITPEKGQEDIFARTMGQFIGAIVPLSGMFKAAGMATRFLAPEIAGTIYGRSMTSALAGGLYGAGSKALEHGGPVSDEMLKEVAWAGVEEALFFGFAHLGIEGVVTAIGMAPQFAKQLKSDIAKAYYRLNPEAAAKGITPDKIMEMMRDDRETAINLIRKVPAARQAWEELNSRAMRTAQESWARQQSEYAASVKAGKVQEMAQAAPRTPQDVVKGISENVPAVRENAFRFIRAEGKEGGGMPGYLESLRADFQNHAGLIQSEGMTPEEFYKTLRAENPSIIPIQPAKVTTSRVPPEPRTAGEVGAPAEQPSQVSPKIETAGTRSTPTPVAAEMAAQKAREQKGTPVPSEAPTPAPDKPEPTAKPEPSAPIIEKAGQKWEVILPDAETAALKAKPGTAQELKAQKEYAIKSVQEALKLPRSDKGGPEKIEISIPGDGDFSIWNNDKALQAAMRGFKKFPANVEGSRKNTVPKPGPSSRADLDKLEGVEYAREYVPKKGKIDKTEISTPQGIRNSVYYQNGIVGNTYMLIKASKPSEFVKEAPRDLSKMLAEESKDIRPINILGEYKPLDDPAMVILENDDQTVAIRARYADAILTEHPGAVPFINEKQHIIWKKGDKVVAALGLLNSKKIGIEEAKKSYLGLRGEKDISTKEMQSRSATAPTGSSAMRPSGAPSVVQGGRGQGGSKPVPTDSELGRRGQEHQRNKGLYSEVSSEIPGVKSYRSIRKQKAVTSEQENKVMEGMSTEEVSAGKKMMYGFPGAPDTVSLAKKLLNKYAVDLSDKDMSLLARYADLPFYVAQTYPNFKHYDIQTARENNRHWMIEDFMSEFVNPIKEYGKLSKTGRKAFNEAIWKADNMQGKVVNDAQLEQFGMPKSMIPHYRTIRELFDFVRDEHLPEVLKFFGLPKTDIDELRREFGRWSNYWPHMREGKYFVSVSGERPAEPKTYEVENIEQAEKEFSDIVKAKSGKPFVSKSQAQTVRGKMGIKETHSIIKLADGGYLLGVGTERQTLFYGQFDDLIATLTGGKISFRAKARMKELAKNYPGDEPPVAGKVVKLPEEVFWRIDTGNMQAIIDSAIDQTKLPQDAKEQLISAVADSLKSRGFGSHLIGRKNIPGWDKADPIKSAIRFFQEYAGFVTKIQAADQFRDAMKLINPEKQKQLWQYANKYVKDMLANQDQFDRSVDKLRGGFFYWFLGGVARQMVLQPTQNFVTFVPILQEYTKWSAAKISSEMSKAMADRVAYWGAKAAGKDIVRGAHRLSDNILAGLDRAKKKGIIDAALTHEYEGYIQSLLGSAGEAIGKPLRFFIGNAELFNRETAYVVAYRAAEDMGKSHFEAMDFAEKIVEKAHFRYGKANLPPFARGGEVAKLARAGYTFRSFNHNMLRLYAQMAGKGTKGHIGILKSIAALLAFGGLGAIPFYDDIEKQLQKMTGKNFRSEVAKTVGDWKYLANYGLPGLIGVDLSGSMGIEMPRSIGEIVGVPIELYNAPRKAWQDWRRGDLQRVAEDLSPAFMRYPLQAYRLASEGLTTRSGKPILDEKGKPIKLSIKEAAIKGLSFKPVRESEASRQYEARETIDDMLTSQKKELLDSYHRMRIRHGKDSKEVATVKQDIKKYNQQLKEMKVKDKSYRITFSTLASRMKKESSGKRWLRKEFQ